MLFRCRPVRRGRRQACPAAAPIIALVGLVIFASRAESQPPTAPSGEPIALAFKHPAGRVQRFRSTTKFNLTLDSGGSAGAATVIPPVALTVDLVSVETVTGVQGTIAALSIRPESLALTAEIFGNKLVMRNAGGKVTTTLNGQPAPPGLSGPGVAGALTDAAPMVLRRDRLGLVAPQAGDSAPPMSLASTTSSPALLLRFPEQPVRVGETWEGSIRSSVAVPGVPGGGATIPDVEVKVSHTLKELQTRNGRRFALIATSATTTVAEARTAQGNTLRNFSQALNGVTRFDLDAGKAIGGTYNVVFSAELPAVAPPGGAPPGTGPIPPAPAAPGSPGGTAPGAGGAAPFRFKIDGTADITVSEAPAAATRPTPAKRTRRKR